MSEKFKKNQRISVAVTRTINTGNYESLKIHSGFATDIREKADINDAYDEAFDVCTKQLLTYEEQVLGGEREV